MYPSTSMQPPSSQPQINNPHQQQPHSMQNYQNSSVPSSSGSVLQDLLLSNPPSNINSPRNQQQFNAHYRPTIGRSPMTGNTAGSTMVSPPNGGPQRPQQQLIHTQQMRPQGPPSGHQMQQQGQVYENYAMPNQTYVYQGNNVVRGTMIRPQPSGMQQGQGARMIMVNGTGTVRKDQVPMQSKFIYHP